MKHRRSPHGTEPCVQAVQLGPGFRRVLGFVLINRPPYLNFDGAWLFNYGVGVHLVQKKDGGRKPTHRPTVSIQCEDMDAVEQKLKEMNLNYMKRTINEEEGAPIDKLFFNNPDGFMVELCKQLQEPGARPRRRFYGAY